MASRRTPRSQTRAAVIILLVGAVLVAWGLLRGSPGDGVVASMPSSPPVFSPSPIDEGPPPLQAEGDFPKTGPGVYLIATTGGPIVGTAGTLKRFRVAVESNVAVEMDEFVRMVDVTLGDERSWIAGKQFRFQRVPEGAPYDFTIYLTTRDSAHKMCSSTGLDIRRNGIPYTSCQQSRRVIINLDRWRLSVPEFVELGIPLDTYRHMVINHEVGHELGKRHQGCPGKGKPAPTMQQQTLSLNGCIANPWPYLDGKLITGPALP